MRFILIHGNSSSPSSFEQAFTINQETQAIRLPGHDGTRSENPDYEYSINGLKDYLRNVIDDNSPFILVGHSLGGHLAMEVASYFRNCAGLIIAGAPPLSKPLNLDEAFLPSDSLGIFLKGDFEETELEEALSCVCLDDQSCERLKSYFKRTDKKFREGFAHSALEKNQLGNEADIIRDLGKPVYVVNGKQDPLVNMEYVRNLKGITRVFEIDSCGHYPTMEKPEEFREILKTIVAEMGISDT